MTDLPQSPTPPSPEGAAAPPPPPPLPWQYGDHNVPPPPPPPDYSVSWQPAAAPRGGRRGLSAALAAIFVIGIGSGVAAARLTSGTPSGSTSTLTPDLSGGGSGGGSGSSGGGSADSSGVAAKVTPGIVNINVTLSSNGGAAGTGMIITSSGEVLTNNHVIDGETSMTVELPSTGKTYSAHVVGYDLTEDVALVQIDGGGTFHTVDIGNSSSVSIGDAVVALGNALGRNGAPSVTTGSVTALNRTITASDQSGADVETVSGLIQIDAQIQPGDSGGPLANSSGTVIGMDTAAEASGRFGQQGSSVAFAIPINKAIGIVKQIQSGVPTSAVHIGDTRALLGVSAQDSSSGVQVVVVAGGSPAAAAGITVGSIITSLDGSTITTNSELRKAIVTHQPGQSVRVDWTDSGGQSRTAQVTLATGPPA